MRRVFVMLFTLVALPSLLACGAIGSKSEPMALRYYSAEVAGDTRPAAPAGNVELRLGRVSASAYLRESMVYRDSAVEVGYYEQRRWTERPDAYLRRALERSLFGARGFRRVSSGGGQTLDVELVAFEEARGPRRARVQVMAVLHDDRDVRWQGTLTVEKPVSGERVEDMVQAISAALAEVVERVGDQVAGVPVAAPSPPQK